MEWLLQEQLILCLLQRLTDLTGRTFWSWFLLPEMHWSFLSSQVCTLVLNTAREVAPPTTPVSQAWQSPFTLWWLETSGNQGHTPTNSEQSNSRRTWFRRGRQHSLMDWLGRVQLVASMLFHWRLEVEDVDSFFRVPLPIRLLGC